MHALNLMETTVPKSSLPNVLLLAGYLNLYQLKKISISSPASEPEHWSREMFKLHFVGLLMPLVSYPIQFAKSNIRV